MQEKIREKRKVKEKHNLFISFMEISGAEEDRTPGLLVANEALSQLSYSP